MAILGKERTKEMEAIYEGVNRLLDVQMADPKYRAYNVMLMGGKAATEAMFQALDEKKPVVSYNLGGIPELMLALGDNEGEVFPFAMEKIVAQQALMGDLNYNLECIDLAEARGMSNDVCSTDRALLGYHLRKVLLESECIVFVTAPNTEEAQTIARKLLSDQLAACVNILPGMISIYTWKGEACEDSEVLLLIKTRAALFEALSATVEAAHPYEVPEIIAIPISAGSSSYLNWIDEVTQQD